jgi:hypothetical protein
VQGSGGTRFFSFQLDKDDQLKWLLAHGGSGNEGGYLAQLAQEENGNVWVAGHFISTMTLQGGVTVSGPRGVEQCFFAHQSGDNGTGGRAYRFGGGAPTFARAVTHSRKRLYVAGDFAGRAEIESFAVESAGASDVFVIAFEP